MPLYEYICGQCGHQCEYLQKISDEPKVLCPECGKNQLKRQVSATRFQLKGSGWYVTDFKNKDAKPKETTSTDTDKPAPPPKPPTETKE